MRQWLGIGFLAGFLFVAGGTGCRTTGGARASERPAWGSTNVPPSAAVVDLPRYVRRPHLTFHNEQEVGEYLVLAAKKQSAVENYRALNRLLMEKALAVQSINQELEKDYNLTPGLRCEYNAETRTIWTTEDDGKGGAVKRDLFRLPDVDSEKRFTRLLELRKQGLIEAATINGGMGRAEKELLRIQKTLADEYSLARDRDYELVPKSRLLIENVPIPQRFEMEGP